MKTIQNYINGKMCDPVNQQWLDVYDPSRGIVYAKAPNSDLADINLAVEAAEAAFKIWSKTSVQYRHDIMSKISQLITQELDTLALAESIDNGKPLWLAKKVDIPRAASNFEFFANAITQYSGQSHEMGDFAINYTLRQPLGVVATISPWNLPLYLFTWKIAPALAAGNTVIAKPSEVTPMTAFLLSDICRKVGLPSGVLNIIHGDGKSTGSSLVNSKKIKAISFTGSTRVGQQIAQIAAKNFKKVSLEMGGKNANLIFDDCDYKAMLKTTVNSSFSNQGQICLCGSRILIQEGIYERFKADFIAATENLIVAPPLSEKLNLGAMVSKAHFEKVLQCIEQAKSEGGHILTGGHSIQFVGEHNNGWYIAPTIIEGLENNCKTNQEEIFGPVVTIQSFKTEDEAIMLANDSQYGLSATVWTNDISRSQRVARNLEAGIIWINTWLTRDLRTPFGGVKNSGVGREGGTYALDFFTEPKNICIKI